MPPVHVRCVCACLPGAARPSTEQRAGASGFQYRSATGSPTTWVDHADVVPPAHAGPDDLAPGITHGPARLVDGYPLRENRTTHELLLTDFHTGTAATRTP
ncbi:hypothetical protein AB0M00_34080 [Streptomyces chartreusis]|uniref:hypothetical protein n=1 Tax=Streptomyces chartreusis TaxID=1969 RepID=UPI00342CC1AE